MKTITKKRLLSIQNQVMFLQRFSQRALTLARPSLLAPLATRAYYKDNVLMPREQGEYYADPMDVAERVVRLIGLHDNCADPAKVTLGSSFDSLGLSALDMCEVYIGCEREFDMQISEEDCEAMQSVNDLVEFLARNPATK